MKKKNEIFKNIKHIHLLTIIEIILLWIYVVEQNYAYLNVCVMAIIVLYKYLA